MKQLFSHTTLSNLLFLILAYLLFILRWGYIYGSGDHIEWLPYILYLSDTSLYPDDFFIRQMAELVPNERIALASLLAKLPGNLYVWMLLLHMSSCMLLIYGMDRIAALYMNNRLLSRALILFNLLIVYTYNLGDSELMANCFQGSLAATALACWAIYFFLQKKYVLCFLLLGITVYLHIIISLDTAILLALVLFVQCLWNRMGFIKWITAIGIYALIAGWYLIWIYSVRQTTTAINMEDYFQILFHFRHPHHFIFGSFPWKKIIWVFLCTAFALFFFRIKEPRLFLFFFFNTVITILYAVSTDVFHFIFIANFQWYKLSMFSVFLGLVAMGALLEKRLAAFLPTIRSLWMSLSSVFLIVLCFYGITILSKQDRTRSIQYDFGAFEKRDSQIDIARKAESITENDALFALPFNCTSFKFFSRRSSYVDFKAVIRTPEGALEWYRRIQQIYGINKELPIKGFALEELADKQYHQMCLAKLNSKNDFPAPITHLLLRKKYMGDLSRWPAAIAENSDYCILKISE